MLLSRKLAVLAATTWFLLSTGAHAIPIVYQFTGTVAEVSLNGAPPVFDRAFTVDLFGDTSGVVSGGPGLLFNPVSSVTFSIAGVGSGTFLDSYRMFLTGSAVGFSHVPDGLDRIDVLNGVFTGFALASAFGPIVTGSNFINQFLPDATTAGDLDMFGGSNVSFRSFFPTAQIPAPASILLFALGLIGLVFSRRKLD